MYTADFLVAVGADVPPAMVVVDETDDVGTRLPGEPDLDQTSSENDGLHCVRLEMPQTRRQFLAASLAASGAAQEARPNFLVVITDDQRWDMMGAAGHPFLQTPNIDRLAREGVRFTNAFVTTSLCSPARASFLTGSYAHAHRVLSNWEDISDDEMRRSFPALLQEQGYETAYIGKFHMGRDPDPRPGFDQWSAFPGQGSYNDPAVNVNGKMQRIKGHSSKVVADLAVEWLGGDRRRPFCAVVGFKESRGPYTPPPHLKNLYADRPVQVDDVKLEHLEGKPSEVEHIQLSTPREADHNIPGWPTDYPSRWQDYWRCITAMDEQLGRILGKLDEKGLAEDTVVVFAGDNGFFLGELGLFDKRFAYEPSIRIPLVARYPRGVKAGQVIDRLVLNIDLCPTVLDYAGIGSLDGTRGESWRPLVEGRPAPNWRRWFLYEDFREHGYVHWPTIQALRTEKWKYIRYPEGGNEDELYDLERDPGELNNVSKENGWTGLQTRLGWEIDRLVGLTS